LEGVESRCELCAASGELIAAQTAQEIKADFLMQ
jgi:hypothetical protein